MINKAILNSVETKTKIVCEELGNGGHGVAFLCQNDGAEDEHMKTFVIKRSPRNKTPREVNEMLTNELTGALITKDMRRCYARKTRMVFGYE